MYEVLGIFGIVFEQPELNFGTVFGQSETGLRFGFDHETNVFEFYGVFLYHSNSVMNCEGTKRCPVLYGSEILIILGVVYCWEKITNMLLCVKIMLICACVMY